MQKVHKGVIVAVLAMVVYSANIWGVSIYFLDEAKNAGCAMEMYQESEWIVPFFNNELRTDKPVLHYYFMKLGYAVFGITPMGARVFSSIMGILTVLSVFFFVKKIVNEEAAFYSSLILIASIQFAVQFHLAVPDPYLLFFLTTAWLSFYYGWHTRSRRFYYLFYFLIGLAFVTKGPIAVVFSGLIVLSFMIVQRQFNWEQIRALRLIEGALIFCVVGLPWYILVGMATQGEWIDQFFFKHNVSRFTETMEGHSGFPFMSVVILMVGLMPFSFFLPQAVRQWWREKDPFVTYCLLVSSIVLLFFAFSKTMLPTYPEPAFPFAAIVVGVFFMKQIANRSQAGWPIAGVIYLVITIAMIPAAHYALSLDDMLFDLSPLAFIFIVLPVGAMIALFLVYKNRFRDVVLVYAASQIVFLLLFFYLLFPALDERNPVTQTLARLNGENVLFYYRDLNPAFVFSLRRQVPRIESIEELKTTLATNGDLYLITTKGHRDELNTMHPEIIFQSKDLFENSETVVLRIAASD